MAPTLRDGDRLRVVAIGGVPARAGEIVLARRGGALVAHRLMALASERAITRGDGQSSDDPPLPASALCGRVVEVERLGRRFLPSTPGAIERGATWLRCLFA